jgi:hypothetical protein
MREETVTAVRFDPILRRQVAVRLTYTVGEGPRPDMVRWFLVREEVQSLLDSQSLNYSEAAGQADVAKERRARPRLRPEDPMESLRRSNSQG